MATGNAGYRCRHGARPCRASGAYAPRGPAASVLYQVVRDHYEAFRVEAAGLRDGEGLPRWSSRRFCGVDGTRQASRGCGAPPWPGCCIGPCTGTCGRGHRRGARRGPKRRGHRRAALWRGAQSQRSPPRPGVGRGLRARKGRPAPVDKGRSVDHRPRLHRLSSYIGCDVDITERKNAFSSRRKHWPVTFVSFRTICTRPCSGTWGW
jgi:hypothetical protein